MLQTTDVDDPGGLDGSESEKTKLTKKKCMNLFDNMVAEYGNPAMWFMGGTLKDGEPQER
mgnify:CR=1 FL=1